MTPDPRWLEVLKASGWQTLAIAAACGIFLLLPQWHLIPPLAPWMVLAATFAFLITGFLTVASFIVAMIRYFPVNRWIGHWINGIRSRRLIRDYIPYMTPKEREIIAYLLGHNQKIFTAAQDGGHAATLLSRGIVAVALRPGQVFVGEDTPMGIPDGVWKVLAQHRDKFPVTQEALDGPHPWRVDWMERI